MWYRGGNPILHQDAWAWAPSQPGAALWAWLCRLTSLTFSFLFWKMKRLVLVNIPHFLLHSYSIFSGLIFLGMLTCIVSDESVEKKPSLCQDLCQYLWVGVWWGMGGTCHSQKSSSFFTKWLNLWYTYFTKVKVTSPTDEQILIEVKSMFFLSHVDFCFRSYLLRRKVWSHIVV